MIRLQQYNINLVYKRGKDLFIADILSGAFNVNDTTNLDLEHDEIEAHINLIQESLNISPVNLSKFQDLISTDEEMKALIKYIVGNK